MATSGSIDFGATRDQLIQEAMEQIGAIDLGGTPSAADLATCARTLNLMLKSWQNDEVNIFAIQKTYLFLDKNVNEYLLGTTAIYSSAINQTTISAAAAATDTTVDLTDTTNAADNSTHILKLDDGQNEFLTQNGAVAGSTMTFDAPAGGLSAAASSGNTIYHFKTGEEANRPMKILTAVRRDKNGIDIPMNLLSLDEYTQLSDKTTDGVPINFYYRPELGFTRVRIWPEPSDVNDYIVLWVQRTLEDLDAASDDVDYPQEWYWAISLGLAMAISSKYGVDAATYNRIKEQFTEAYWMASSADVDEAGTEFEPNMRGD